MQKNECSVKVGGAGLLLDDLELFQTFARVYCDRFREPPFSDNVEPVEVQNRFIRQANINGRSTRVVRATVGHKFGGASWMWGGMETHTWLTSVAEAIGEVRGSGVASVAHGGFMRENIDAGGTDYVADLLVAKEYEGTLLASMMMLELAKSGQNMGIGNYVFWTLANSGMKVIMEKRLGGRVMADLGDGSVLMQGSYQTAQEKLARLVNG